MTTTTGLEIALEAQGSLPNFRYDIMLPLMSGRVAIDGVTLQPTGPNDVAGYYANPKFKNGDFGLLDTNFGDVVPAIDAGWNLISLPVFIKRKPAYNYSWVRADRGIDSPKDLEGKTFSSVGYGSTITVFTRGFLQHFHSVDISKLRWLLNGPYQFELHDKKAQIEIASGTPKAPWQRLIDGEVDAITGDITDSAAWSALESSSQVKRLFPNYQELNQRLHREHGIYTPVHLIVMSTKLDRAHPDLARKVQDAFERSKEQAYDDALSDKASSSMTLYNREHMRDQLRDWGDIHAYGISANRRMLETYLDYSFEQGITRTRLTLEQVFAKGTLDT